MFQVEKPLYPTGLSHTSLLQRYNLECIPCMMGEVGGRYEAVLWVFIVISGFGHAGGGLCSLNCGDVKSTDAAGLA